MEYIEAYNGFRGIAFLNVLVDHYTWVDNCTLDIGQFGVGMFYVLSSYLLTLILYKNFLEKGSMNIVNYWIRRFFRIYPCLTVALICEFITGRLNIKEIGHVFFLTGIRGVYWAIYIELRYYVLIPMIVFLFGKITNLKVKFLTMFVITCLFFLYHFYLNFLSDGKGFRRWDIDDFSFEKNIVFIYYIPVFALGSFMSIIVYHLKEINYDFNSHSVIKGIFTFIFGFVHAPLIYYRCLYGNETFWGLPWSNFNLLFGIGYILIFMWFNGRNFMMKFYEHKVVAFFGKISYPAYLLHTCVREYFFKYHGWDKKFPDLFCCFLFTIAIAYLLHITVENFCIRKTKFWFYIKTENNTPRENTSDNNNDIINTIAYNKIDFEMSSEDLEQKNRVK